MFFFAIRSNDTLLEYGGLCSAHITRMTHQRFKAGERVCALAVRLALKRAVWQNGWRARSARLKPPYSNRGVEKFFNLLSEGG